ncbi:hypothetical protein ACFL6K_02130 [Candidatus Latescibacterota bacterium]
MSESEITEKDRANAQTCVDCPVCKRARKKQKGFFYWFVKNVESGFCPKCAAYERVYGRKAHEPVPVENS